MKKANKKKKTFLFTFGFGSLLEAFSGHKISVHFLTESQMLSAKPKSKGGKFGGKNNSLMVWIKQNKRKCV